MRHLVLTLPILMCAGCASSGDNGDGYPEPNSLMKQEIENRIAQIPYQHQNELIDNMLWLATKAGEQAITSLLPALKHRNPKVRSNAAWILCKIGNRKVIPELRQHVRDPHLSVRLEVARSLVYLGDRTHIPTLIEGLDADNLPVRYHCHIALKDVTKRDFGYDHLIESDVERRRSVLAWRKWWSDQSRDPWFAASYAKRYNLDDQPQLARPAPMDETAPSKETPKMQPVRSKAKPSMTPAPKTPRIKPSARPSIRRALPLQPKSTPAPKPSPTKKVMAKPVVTPKASTTTNNSKEDEDVNWESIIIPSRKKSPSTDEPKSSTSRPSYMNRNG